MIVLTTRHTTSPVYEFTKQCTSFDEFIYQSVDSNPSLTTNIGEMASIGEECSNQGQCFHCIIGSFACSELRAGFKASKTTLHIGCCCGRVMCWRRMKKSRRSIKLGAR